MIEKLKSVLYFPLAYYFRFFAAIRLRRWNPRIIVVTGSNGKTTLLHLLESQIGKQAKYSHHANSAYGIPFDILGLHRQTFKSSEWISLFLKAPFCVFAPSPRERIYVVEADCDRPDEGKFLGSLLHPEVVLWTSLSGTHSMNFDALIRKGKFSNVKDAIAYEFGYFLKYCTQLAVIVGDNELQMEQRSRSNATIFPIKKAIALQKYTIDQKKTTFIIDKQAYTFPALLPEEIFYSILMCRKAVEYFGLHFDSNFKQFTLPEGRSSLFEGIKDTVLVDSTYNANLSSILAILAMFEKLPSKKKWVVLGDMLELGETEQMQHEQLAETLAKMHLDKIILIGPKNNKYTYPKLQSLVKNTDSIVSFVSLIDASEHLQQNIQGKEAILFKGSQSLLLEWCIEPLLAKKSDAAKLPRRGEFWDAHRAKKGLK